ncbi:hypothetical protein [Peribacillus asahii]
MGEKKQKSPFLTNKPFGTLPKRDKDDSPLLKLIYITAKGYVIRGL